ncbi:tyrosine-type recombinase/integrase [Nocardioides lijunqiniae]|uniref:tyrosine-type recombinase/integrase n=1 Tax=Nocardioides lijunqiniae TaxID=2760832 RepID=UPI001878B05E|nr:site-specific integrase [Nocardioides lijunqiniae]
MVRKALGLGEHGEIETTPQVRDGNRWVTAPNPRRAERHRARAYFRGWDGVRRDVTVVANTKAAAIKGCETRLTERLRQPVASEQTITKSTPFTTAGQVWLAQAARTDSGLAARSGFDYRTSFERHIDTDGSSLRGLTLEQANDPQRLRIFLQTLADRRGSGASKLTRSVISNILNFAVDSGVLTSNAMRQIRAVKSQNPKVELRDRTRAFTREERDHVIAYADQAAARLDLNPRSVRRRETAAGLIGFLAGTGARIDEGRSMRWDDYDPTTGTCRIRGTKSTSSDRVVNLPQWLRDRLEQRATRTGRNGLMFAAPALLEGEEQKWDQGNSNAAIREMLDGAGYTWAVPHTFRRTVATLLHEAGVPIVRIADQLGHADPGMTARVYLGRDFEGDKSDLAIHL